MLKNENNSEEVYIRGNKHSLTITLLISFFVYLLLVVGLMWDFHKGSMQALGIISVLYLILLSRMFFLWMNDCVVAKIEGGVLYERGWFWGYKRVLSISEIHSLKTTTDRGGRGPRWPSLDITTKNNTHKYVYMEWWEHRNVNELKNYVENFFSKSK